MTEQPTQIELEGRKNALLRLFDRLVPLVDGLSKTIGFTALMQLALVAWIFVWMYHFKEFTLPVSLVACLIMLLPILVLMYFRSGLKQLKQLVDTVVTTILGAKNELQERVLDLRSAERKKAGLMGSAKNIFKLGSLVGEARELMGSYVHVGSMVNPLLLLLGFLSIMYIVPLFLVSALMALLEFWPF
jgi:hypothetical protein